jgi:spermidine synthase
MSQQNLSQRRAPGGNVEFFSGHRFLPLLLVLFVGSGYSALVYEIVWFQLLQLVIGSSAVSLGVLLGTYMGGMCLGSVALPRIISARYHPLRVYALLELGIGIIGIAVLFGIPYVDRLYAANVGHGLAGVWLRGLVCAVCLLPPTLLMGATLPAIARWVETTPQGVSWLGLFYGGNIAGAVFGCLLAGFYLLRVHDMAAATYAAATVNGAVALMGLALARLTPHRVPAPAPGDASSFNPAQDRRGGGPTGEPAQARTVPAPAPRLPAGRQEWGWPVYVAIALSGTSALGAEVVWTRLLSLLLGGTVYTFSIILAVFLAGLGIGSSVGSFLSRVVARPRIALGCCQMFLTAAIAWTAYVVAKSLPYWPIDPSLSSSPWFNFQLDLTRCAWAVLPAALLWGASFPLALAAACPPYVWRVNRRGGDPGRLVGGVYAANTVGAIVGSIGFSMLVVPWLGTQQAQRLMIGLSAVAAFLMFLPLVRPLWANPGVLECRISNREYRSSKFLIRYSLFVPVMGLVALLAWSVSPTPWGLIAYGRFMATYGGRLAPGITEEKDVPSEGGKPDIFCTYMGEGMNGSAVVTMSKAGVRCFHSAGKVQASSEPQDMRLQRMLGHISALLHPKPCSVLVVGCGAGVTAGTFLLHPSIERIIICEIEPLVPKFVAPKFKTENYNVVDDPRVEVVYDDARHYIRTTRRKFDIITSDPIDPWVKGCAALYTQDYYKMISEHLNPGGVVTLWIPLYEGNSDTVKSVIATFFRVFPNGLIWSNDIKGEGYDAVLFGQVPAQARDDGRDTMDERRCTSEERRATSDGRRTTGDERRATKIDLDELQRRLDAPSMRKVAQSLGEVGFASAIDLLATYAGQAPDLQEWLRDAQINTDRNLRLQYLAGMWLNSYLGRQILAEIIQYYRFPEELFIASDQSKEALRQALEGLQSRQ